MNGCTVPGNQKVDSTERKPSAARLPWHLEGMKGSLRDMSHKQAAKPYHESDHREKVSMETEEPAQANQRYRVQVLKRQNYFAHPLFNEHTTQVVAQPATPSGIPEVGDCEGSRVLSHVTNSYPAMPNPKRGRAPSSTAPTSARPPLQSRSPPPAGIAPTEATRETRACLRVPATSAITSSFSKRGVTPWTPSKIRELLAILLVERQRYDKRKTDFYRYAASRLGFGNDMVRVKNKVERLLREYHAADSHGGNRGTLEFYPELHMVFGIVGHSSSEGEGTAAVPNDGTSRSSTRSSGTDTSSPTTCARVPTGRTALAQGHRYTSPKRIVPPTHPTRLGGWLPHSKRPRLTVHSKKNHNCRSRVHFHGDRNDFYQHPKACNAGDAQSSAQQEAHDGIARAFQKGPQDPAGSMTSRKRLRPPHDSNMSPTPCLGHESPTDQGNVSARLRPPMPLSHATWTWKGRDPGTNDESPAVGRLPLPSRYLPPPISDPPASSTQGGLPARNLSQSESPGDHSCDSPSSIQGSVQSAFSTKRLPPLIKPYAKAATSMSTANGFDRHSGRELEDTLDAKASLDCSGDISLLRFEIAELARKVDRQSQALQNLQAWLHILIEKVGGNLERDTCEPCRKGSEPSPLVENYDQSEAERMISGGTRQG